MLVARNSTIRFMSSLREGSPLPEGSAAGGGFQAPWTARTGCRPRNRRTCRARTATAGRLAFAARLALGTAAAHPLARAQHLHSIGHDLGGVLVVAVLVLPLARLQPPLDVDLRALLEIFARDLGQPPEEGDAVPLRLLLLLALLVLPRVRGRDRDVRDRRAVGHVAGLGIAPEVADEDHLVHRCHVVSSFFARCVLPGRPRMATLPCSMPPRARRP